MYIFAHLVIVFVILFFNYNWIILYSEIKNGNKNARIVLFDLSSMKGRTIMEDIEVEYLKYYENGDIIVSLYLYFFKNHNLNIFKL